MLFCVPQVDFPAAWAHRFFRRGKEFYMANERRDRISMSSVVTHMCSINGSGLVFHSSDAMPVSSEVKLTIETNHHGQKNHWKVEGWVVECHPADIEEDHLAFQVTMLFSDIPQALRELLQENDILNRASYPPVPGAEMFGLN